MKTNNLKIAVTTLLLSAGVLSAPGVMAASASASLEITEIIVTPLAPGASISWTSDLDRSSSFATSPFPHTTDLHTDSNHDWNSFLGTEATTSNASASNSSTLINLWPKLDSFAQASTATVPADYGWRASMAGSYINDIRNFTTSGPLEILVSGDYSLFADSGSGNGIASAFASLGIYFNNYSDDKVIFSVDQDSVTSDSEVNPSILTADGTFTLKIITIENGYGSIEGSASTNVDQAALQVPEPETYAMLLAGLGLIGFSAYRHK